MGRVKGGPTGSTLGLTLGGRSRCRCCMKNTFYSKELDKAMLCKDCRPHWETEMGKCPILNRENYSDPKKLLPECNPAGAPVTGTGMIQSPSVLGTSENVNDLRREL